MYLKDEFFTPCDVREGKTIEVFISKDDEARERLKIQIVMPDKRPVRRPPVKLTDYDTMALISVLFDALNEAGQSRMVCSQSKFGKQVREMLKRREITRAVFGV